MNLAEAESFLEGRVSAKRRAAHAIEAAKGASLRSYLFAEEVAFADDPHRYVTACCGRRAGKSTTVAVKLLEAALKYPARFSVLYLSLTRDHAKGIIWGPLKALNEQYGLGGKPNEADLTMTMPTGTVIAIRGVDKRKEIEKRRGFGFALVVIDECQSIPEHVRSLVDEVIEPALSDAPGRLVMIGTPSLVVGGYWFDCHHNRNRDASGTEVWGHHAWDMWSNPHIPDPEAALLQVLARRGVTREHASIQREYFGRWVRDESSAVFAFDPVRNGYAALPSDLPAELWRYVIAVDIGGGVERDNDAVSVLTFNEQARATYLVEEHVSGKQDVTALAQKVAGIRERLGVRNVVAIVADTGGIGAKVAQEMQARYGLPVEAAKKQDKWANIELLNAACRHGEFFARPESLFAAEAPKVEKDWDKSGPDHIEIKGHMPDVVDSVIYGFVRSLAWTSRVPKKRADPGSPQAAAAEAQRLMEETRRAVIAEKHAKDEMYGPLDFGGWGFD